MQAAAAAVVVLLAALVPAASAAVITTKQGVSSLWGESGELYDPAGLLFDYR